MPHHLIVPILLLATPPTPPADDKVSEELISLRSQLFDAGEERALRDVPRFRPLCDEDGYPLVGNAVRKGKLYQPSQFCREVRKRAKDKA